MPTESGLVATRSAPERVRQAPGKLAAVAKYDALHDHLDDAADGPVEMTFAEIERVVGPLPRSARTHRPWWGNERSIGRHVQARAWLDAGREVASVDLNAARVRFTARSLGSDRR